MVTWFASSFFFAFSRGELFHRWFVVLSATVVYVIVLLFCVLCFVLEVVTVQLCADARVPVSPVLLSWIRLYR